MTYFTSTEQGKLTKTIYSLLIHDVSLNKMDIDQFQAISGKHYSDNSSLDIYTHVCME